MDIRELHERYQDAENKALLFRGLYERVYQLIAPQRNLYTGGPGSNKNPRMFDSTGPISANGFVNTAMNLITPVHTRWIDLKAGTRMAEVVLFQRLMAKGIDPRTVPVFDEDIDNEEQNINGKLDLVTKNMFSYLNASNLYSELANGYMDLCVGTMAILVMPSDGKFNRDIGSPIRYKAVSPYFLSLDEGPYGEISGIYRCIESKARNILAEWSGIKGLRYDGEDQLVKIKECTVFNERQNIWDYYIIQGDQIVLKSYFEVNPWVIFRWSVIPGEIWGRGLGIQALPDLQQLNAAKELAIKSSQLSAYGAYTVIADDVINPNSIRVAPGALIPVKRNNGPNGPSIAPLPGIGNANHQLLIENDLGTKIRRFMLDDGLPSPESPKMTATEVVERVRHIQKNFGAVFGRISYEFLQPLIRRSLDVLIKQGVIEMPEEYNRIDSFNLKMQVISPVARMQAIQDVEALIQTIQTIGGISPELVQRGIKIEELAPWLGDKLGAPAKFFRSDEEISQIDAERQAQMLQLEAQQTGQEQLAQVV